MLLLDGQELKEIANLRFWALIDVRYGRLTPLNSVKAAFSSFFVLSARILGYYALRPVSG